MSSKQDAQRRLAAMQYELRQLNNSLRDMKTAMHCLQENISDLESDLAKLTKGKEEDAHVQ